MNALPRGPLANKGAIDRSHSLQRGRTLFAIAGAKSIPGKKCASRLGMHGHLVAILHHRFRNLGTATGAMKTAPGSEKTRQWLGEIPVKIKGPEGSEVTKAMEAELLMDIAQAVNGSEAWMKWHRRGFHLSAFNFRAREDPK